MYFSRKGEEFFKKYNEIWEKIRKFHFSKYKSFSWKNITKFHFPKFLRFDQQSFRNAGKYKKVFQVGFFGKI